MRCPLLRPHPAQRLRLVEIRDNLIARIAEAQREGWLGEVDRHARNRGVVDLGTPTVPPADELGGPARLPPRDGYPADV